MKKVWNTVLALSLLTVPLATPVFADENSSMINITIDGKALTTDQQPVIQNGRTLVPLRSIFEALGTQVQWDQASQKITAIKGSSTITLTVGSVIANNNGTSIALDQAPVIMNSRTLVPTRFVAEALGDQVTWDESAQTVTISSPSGQSNPSTQSSNQSTQTSPTSITSSASGVTSTNVDNPAKYQNVTEVNYALAVEMANAASYSLKNSQADIDRAKETLDKASDNVKYTPSGGGNSSASNTFTQYAQAQITQQTAYKNVQKAQDQLAYQVKTAYNAVLLALDNKKLADATLDNARVQYQVASAMHQNGMNTDADLLKASNSVDSATASQQQAAKAIKDTYQSLNTLIGLSPDARPTLTDIPTMKKLDSTVDVENKVTQAVSQSPTIWADQQAVTTSNLAVKMYTFNTPSTDTYQAKQIDVTKAQNTVQADTDSLEKSVRSTYYSIKQSEDQYDNLLTQLSTDQATLKTIQAQFNAGMATKAQLVAAQYTLAKDNNSILSLIISHDNNVIVLDKPWVSGK
jgi:hypothetical protein